MVNRRSLLKSSMLTLAGCATAKVSAESDPKNSLDSSVPFSPIFPGIWRARGGSPERYTPVSSRMVPPHEDGLHRMEAAADLPFASIMGKGDARGCLLTFPLAPREEIFGFGLQLLSFAQRGKKKTMRVKADPKVDTGDSHAPVPFFVSTKGYGIFVDTCRYACFYCGDARLKPSVQAPKYDCMATPASTRNLPPEEPGHIVVDVPRANGVD